MDWIIVTLIAAVIAAAAGYVGLGFLLQWLAEEDVLFTTVREGTAKAIMRGRTFDRYIMSFTGHHFDSQWNIVDNEGSPDYDFDNRRPLLKHLGLYWIGWPWINRVYVYTFEWNETRTNDEGKEAIFPRAEATDFIFVADFTYAIVTEAAETADRLPVDMRTLVTVAITNPYRALFSGEDWMRRVTAAINRHARSFAATKKYEMLLKTGSPAGTDLEKREYSGPIIDLAKELPDDILNDSRKGLRGRYGVTIRTADLQIVELTGTAKPESEKAAIAEYVAQQQATATIAAGEATAHVTRITSEAEAQALRVRLEAIREYGPAGALLAQLDAMRDASNKAGNTIIWANNPLIASIEQFLKEKGGGEKK